MLATVRKLFERAPDARRDDPSWVNLSVAGYGTVNAAMAEQLSAVFACVDVISSALASLPPRVYRRVGTEREAVSPDDAIYRVLAEPNPWQTWPDFVQWYIAQCLLYGNAVAIIERGNQLVPVGWPHVGTRLMPDRSILYDYSYGHGALNVHDTARTDSVMHMRDRTDDGMIGRSRLSRASATVNLALALNDASEALWKGGAFPSGALKLQGRLNPEQKSRLRRQLEQQFAGADNRGKMLILDGAEDWQKISVDPDDMQHLESRKFALAEIARLFEVPPPLIQDYEHNTFTNSQEAGTWFATYTLGGWARKFEATFSRAMLADDQYLEFDMSAFTRTNHSERWEAYKIALETGVLTPEDVRRLEGF